MMRRILVDHARKHVSIKRGGSLARISLEQAALFSQEHPRELVAVDELLTRLGSLDPQASRIVELRFFAGFSLEETAEITGLSPAKVRREWSLAKAWLARELLIAFSQQNDVRDIPFANDSQHFTIGRPVKIADPF